MKKIAQKMMVSGHPKLNLNPTLYFSTRNLNVLTKISSYRETTTLQVQSDWRYNLKSVTKQNAHHVKMMEISINGYNASS